MYITFARVPSDLTFSMEQRYSSPLYLDENKDVTYFLSNSLQILFRSHYYRLIFVLFLYRFRSSTVQNTDTDTP
jgi:hypothetical protein